MSFMTVVLMVLLALEVHYISTYLNFAFGSSCRSSVLARHVARRRDTGLRPDRPSLTAWDMLAKQVDSWLGVDDLFHLPTSYTKQH